MLPSVAAFVDADIVLRPEFDRILDLASDDHSARRDGESKFRLAVLCESGLVVADGL
jgi:hypothetical protein